MLDEDYTDLAGEFGQVGEMSGLGMPEDSRTE